MSGYNNLHGRNEHAYQPARVAIMNTRGHSQAIENTMQPTRVAVPNSLQPTMVADQQRRRYQPHITGYERSLTDYAVCRCATPNSHNDAYTPIATSERYDGIPRLSLSNTPLSWEEETHRKLDVLGRDRATLAEMETTWSRVYNAETTRLLEQQRRNGRWALERGLVVAGVPHDAIWHGSVNPKGCAVSPPPLSQGAVFVGAQGMWRPTGVPASQGQAARGRPTTMGLSWGASQYMPRDSPTQRQPAGRRPTTMGYPWGASHYNPPGPSTRGRR
jgi:hypothetical protein